MGGQKSANLAATVPCIMALTYRRAGVCSYVAVTRLEIDVIADKRFRAPRVSRHVLARSAS